jgi:hypothetical protein
VDNLQVPGAVFYARICGATLARAHARWGGRIAIASYLGGGDAFDRAIAGFSAAYADQNERDYRAFAAAVSSGRLAARPGLRRRAARPSRSRKSPKTPFSPGRGALENEWPVITKVLDHHSSNSRGGFRHDPYRGSHLASAIFTLLTWYFTLTLLICYRPGVTLPERHRVV